MEFGCLPSKVCFSFKLLKFSGQHCADVLQSLQLCPTLCDPRDCSSPGSSVHGILQARILEWVAMPSFRGSSRPRDKTHVCFVFCITGGFFTTEPPGKTSVEITTTQPIAQVKIQGAPSIPSSLSSPHPNAKLHHLLLRNTSPICPCLSIPWLMPRCRPPSVFISPPFSTALVPVLNTVIFAKYECDQLTHQFKFTASSQSKFQFLNRAYTALRVQNHVSLTDSCLCYELYTILTITRLFLPLHMLPWLHSFNTFREGS